MEEIKPESKVWVVEDMPIQTKPVLVNKEKNIALADEGIQLEILNKLEEILKLLKK